MKLLFKRGGFELRELVSIMWEGRLIQSVKSLTRTHTDLSLTRRGFPSTWLWVWTAAPSRFPDCQAPLPGSPASVGLGRVIKPTPRQIHECFGFCFSGELYSSACGGLRTASAKIWVSVLGEILPSSVILQGP